MSHSPEELIDPEMAGIFEGLRPGLVLNLADLDGQNLEDLNVAIQVMSWGDQAVLNAYGLITLEREGKNKRVTALLKLVKATRAAAVSRSCWER